VTILTIFQLNFCTLNFESQDYSTQIGTLHLVSMIHSGMDFELLWHFVKETWKIQLWPTDNTVVYGSIVWSCVV